MNNVVWFPFYDRVARAFWKFVDEGAEHDSLAYLSRVIKTFAPVDQGSLTVAIHALKNRVSK